MRREIIIGTVGALALVVGINTTRGISDPDPYVILDNARSYWLSQHYPAYINYAIKIGVVERGAQRDETYQSAYNNVTGDIWLNPRSDYEQAHPATGKGVTFCFMQCPPGPQPDRHVDFFGVPLLSPIYDFQLAPLARSTAPPTPSPMDIVLQVRKEFNDPLPPGRTLRPASPTPHEPATIATVRVSNRRYTVVNVGIEDVSGIACFHLKLTPVAEPDKYRLRDIWVDTTSSATVQLNVSGNFIDGPGAEVPWTIKFAEINGTRYIAEERTTAPLRYGGARYSEVRISFNDITAVPSPRPSTMVGAFLILREP